MSLFTPEPPLDKPVDGFVMTLFGPMQVRVYGHLLAAFRSRKALWVLALLTLRHDRPVERDWLAGTLWPDIDQSQAFANLRPVLSELRTALGDQGKRLQSPDRQTLLLDLTGAEVDVLAFDAAIKRASLSELAEAVTHYQGALLEGCTEEWVFQERSAREQGCLQALQKLGDAALTAGSYAAAIGYYQKAVSLDGWSDGARRGWMEALAKKGDRNAALQVYRQFVESLRDDPGAAPDPLTSALYARLRAEARQPIGTHAVVVQSAGGRTAVPTVTGYLPHALTDLVGRQDERLEIAARLGRSRLVTLTGTGGIGKTRLASAVASDCVQEYADGVWLVALEAVSDGRLVAQQIASVLGLKEESGRTALQNVTEHLRKKRLLLVLDNCEHVLAAGASVAAMLLRECAGVRILATSREALGITGETVWSVPSLAVPDAAHLPTGQATLLRVLQSYESVQLFVERAQAVQQSFALTQSNARAVTQVCVRLEGIPLALELAAARVRAMTVEQIATRLDAHLELLSGRRTMGQSRQQTLRTTLDWSYALLTEQEMRLLHRLSVFAEGWTLEAAEHVCSAFHIEIGQILDLLGSLADKSLVSFSEQKRGGRYRLLEMVRQYGAEKLVESGEAKQCKGRHRDYFLALAEEAEPELTGADQAVWLERLEAEHANLRTALDWSAAEDEGAQTGLQLAGALYRFWEIHGHYSEGRTYLSRALTREGAAQPTNERARALDGAGVLAYYQGDSPSARLLQEESLGISRELGNSQGIAWSLNHLGDVVWAQGDRDAALRMYEESLAIFRDLGHQQGAAALLHHLGKFYREQGDYEKARALYEEGMSIVREMGNQQNVAWSLHHLGNVAWAQGDNGAASTLQEESLAIFRGLGNLQGIAWSLNELGSIAVAQGNWEMAQAHYEESLSIFRGLGNRQGTATLLYHLGTVLGEQGDYRVARSHYEENLAITRELGNRHNIAWSLQHLGRIEYEQGSSTAARKLYAEGIRLLIELGDESGAARGLTGLAEAMLGKAEFHNSVRAFGAAQRLRDKIDAPLLQAEQQAQRMHLNQARLKLGADTFDTEWKQGDAMSFEQSLAAILIEEIRAL